MATVPDDNFSGLSFADQNTLANSGVYARGSFGEQAHLANQTGANAAVDNAIKRYQAMQALVQPLSAPQSQSTTGLNGEKNIEFILARLRRLEAMIDGATISASCSTTDSTITVTLNWGAS